MAGHPNPHDRCRLHHRPEDGATAIHLLLSPAIDHRDHLRLAAMQRSVPWLWILAIGLLVLAPGLTFRLFVDVLEGAALLAVVVPLLLAGAGLIAWQWAKRRLTICPVCGTPSLGVLQCPACGASLVDASDATSTASTTPWSATPSDPRAADVVIDVTVSEVNEER